MNAEKESDLNTFSLGLLEAESLGYNFVCRTAASFVSSRAGLPPRPLLTYQPPHSQSKGSSLARGGLIVVGSYVPKSTAQLTHLLNQMDVTSVELDVQSLINSLRSMHLSGDEDVLYSKVLSQSSAIKNTIQSLAAQMNRNIAQGQHTVLYTPREFVQGATIYETGFVSYCITQIVQGVCRSFDIKPLYIIAKGGITSHEVAQYGLGITIAKVLGQIEPGVPVWEPVSTKDDDQDAAVISNAQNNKQSSREFTMKYIVFPGNVGDDAALSNVAAKLGCPKKEHPLRVGSGTNDEMKVAIKEARDNKYAIGAFNICKLFLFCAFFFIAVLNQPSLTLPAVR